MKPWGPQSICLPVLDKNSKERFSKERPTPLLLFAKRNTRSLWRLTINCFSAIAIPRRSTKERIVLQDLFVMKMNQNLDSNNKTIWMTFRVQCDISLLSSVGGKWCFRHEKQKIDNFPRLVLGMLWKTKCYNWILVWLVERI